MIPRFVAGCVVAASLLLLAGCGTPYSRDNGYGGYSDSPIEKNLYRIVFTSPGGLNDGQIRDLALLRAAQVSRDGGYGAFTVVRENRGYTTRASLGPPPGYMSFYAHPMWVPGPPGYGPQMVMVYDDWGPAWPQDYAVSARYVELFIRAYPTRKAASGTAYSVPSVIAEMKAKYKLK